jgi:hypothetical protein
VTDDASISTAARAALNENNMIDSGGALALPISEHGDVTAKITAN